MEQVELASSQGSKMSSGDDEDDKSSDSSSDDSSDIATRLAEIELQYKKEGARDDEEEDGDDESDEEMKEVEEVKGGGEKKAEVEESRKQDEDDAQDEARAAQLNRLKVADLKQVCRDQGLKVGGKKSELIQRIMDAEKSEVTEGTGANIRTPAVVGEPPKWTESKARDTTYALIVDKTIPPREEIKPKEVYEKYLKHLPEFVYFQDYTKLDFAGKLGYLRDKAAEREDRSKEDAEAFNHDRLIFPPRTEDTKGRPIWAGSAAQRLLREDIKNGVHKKKFPRHLYETREEYNENYDLDFFRDKIYQEVKALKREAWVKTKEEKKKNKKKNKK